MDSENAWKKPKYKNWVRGAKGLEYLQRGLENAVAELVVCQRDQIVRNITSSIPGTAVQCNQCSGINLLPEHAVSNNCKNNCLQRKSANCFGSRKTNRRVCPNGVCSKLYDEIVNSHRHKDPLWANTDPSTWCSDRAGWSFAKCFQTTPSTGISSSETDAAGLLSIILNDTFFQKEVACNLLAPNNDFCKARTKRNSILHSAKMELEDTELQDCIDVFINVLKDQTRLLTDPAACEAVQNLVQLKNNEITISLSEEVKLVQVRKEALIALEQLQDKIQEGVAEIATRAQQAQVNIKEEESSVLEQLQEKKQEGVAEIATQAQQAQVNIKEEESSVLEQLQEKKQEGVAEIATQAQQAQVNIKEEESSVLEQLQEKKQEVERHSQEALTKIERKTSYALEEIGKHDIHQRLKQTEMTIEHLTNTIQRLKMTTSVQERTDETIPRSKQMSSCSGMLSEEDKEKAAYDKMKSNLQDDLISFYKDRHNSIHLSPLMDKQQPLLKFYVMPEIQLVKVTTSRDGDREEKTPVNTLRDMFYKENKLCKNTYMMADAGYGKTTFSKKLALAWCQAKQADKNEEKHFSKDEIPTMGGFSFVFVVLLRDSSRECDIDELIRNQILLQLPNECSLPNLRKILSEETCLVILDGLDEWTHPARSCRQGESNIPHQRVRENVAVLTTSRPWKLSVSGLHSSQIDQKLELKGLSYDSAKKLKRSVISHMHGEENEEKIKKHEYEFNKTVEDSHKSDLTAIPLFLMYLLFLWYYKFKVGKSLADLYSSFIELLLSRTLSKKGINEPKTETVRGDIPPCFNDKKLCKKFYTLLTTLGKLAFYTLFSEMKENMLVFDGSVAKKYLSEEELTFCLKTGIITQSKVLGDVSLQQKTKVAFAHKTMQEFLAALYINSVTDQSSVQETVVSKCKCVRDILEMSKMLMFIVSISARFSFTQELVKNINEDEITQGYRRSLQDGDDHPLKDLQDMYISWYKEIPRENEVSLCLQDVFIDRSCRQKEYRENLERLTTRNKQNIRSVYIDMSHMEDTPYNTGRKVIDYFSLRDLENIEKIHCTRGECSDDVILPLLNSSVKSLCLWCDPRGSWSWSLFDKVTSLHKLEAIGIFGFNMSHSEWRLLVDFISQRDSLREIELGLLSCTDHEESPCTGLDLSRLSSLRKLTLGWLKLSQVIINMASLEECVLELFYNRDSVLKFINCADNKLNTFSCVGPQSSAAGDEIVRTLRHSRHIRYIQLHDVTMEASALGKLVDSVLKLKQPVTVYIGGCPISPREEFETLKGKIKTSQRVRRLEDDEGWFLFETQDGD